MRLTYRNHGSAASRAAARESGMKRHRQPDLHDAGLEAKELEASFNATRCEFIRVELDLGITFCEVAASSTDQEKVRRNKKHAQEAHEAAIRFLSKSRLSEPMKQEIQGKVDRLESLLKDI